MNAETRNNWNVLLENFQEIQKDIYFNEEYVRLYETSQEQAVCFVYNEEKNFFMLPYLLRECKQIGQDIYYDFETAYGYGGPIYNTDNADFIARAWREFFCYAKKHNYVAGFIRFHPLLRNEEHFSQIGQAINDRHTVAIDLSGSEEDIWKAEIHTKNRNVIKRGSKEGLVFTADYNFEQLPEFIELYNATMNKLGADPFYYFDDTYYHKLMTTSKKAFLGVVKKGDQVIAAAIFFYSKCYGHYHLSGSDKNFLNLSPNNFLLWEAAKELRRQGIGVFHLGGATDSDENNPLLQFKRKFSKRLYDFHIGKVVFNPDMYEKLCTDWEKINPERSEGMKHILLKYKY